jgi:hypothetical protein
VNILCELMDQESVLGYRSLPEVIFETQIADGNVVTSDVKEQHIGQC